MKKIFSLLIALLLLAVPALADEHESHVLAPENSGIALTMDHEWFHALAQYLYAVGDRAASDPCEYSDLMFIYVNPDEASIPEDGVILFALSNRLEGSEHAPDTQTYTPFACSEVLMSENGREMLLWYADPATLPEHLADTMMLPVNRLLANPADVAISEPVPMPDAVGFDALYGQSIADLSPVNADVLQGKKLTMINVWATYCNPCINEMPELAQLNKDYADKGVQVIGVLTDLGSTEAYDGEAMDYARAIIDSTGADYLHILPGEGMFFGALNDITAVPTTYFVDENGQIIGEPYVGSRDYDGWAAIVDDLLTNME